MTDNAAQKASGRKGRTSAMAKSALTKGPITTKARKVSISAPTAKSSASPVVNLARSDNNESPQEQQEGSYVEKYRRKYPDKELTFTDKDRAAAMAMGTKDIKVSLQVKKKREKKQDEPGEREFQIRFALVDKELRNSNPKRALLFINKALEFHPKSKICFVARSKCHLLLGLPKLALSDAETALRVDGKYVKGIYAKANALYALGDFEHALVYYHRGHNLRPEMEEFRLGIQKAQEVILNVINYADVQSPESKGSSSGRSGASPVAQEKPTSTGDLQLDVDFLNSLMSNPEICSLKSSDHREITNDVNEVLKFLQNRQEFWSQQRPRNSKMLNHSNIN